MKNISNDMETMPISKLAFKISIPMVISMISIALYGIVDTMFISKISNEALTAAALSIPIQSIITAIALGTSIGLNALLAKTLGENNEKKTKSIIKLGLIITFISWVVIVIASKLSLNSFFSLFTQNENIKKLGYNYLSIISLFSIWSLYQILFEKILEAYGKTKSSMIIQFGGAIINLILDPILIFGYFGIPPLGISGAAISSVIGQFIGMLIGMIIILKDNIFTLNELLKIKIEKSIFKDIFKVGLPTMILESVASFITLILNRVLGEFSDNAISVWGIYCQLQKFVIIIVYGFNYGMIPIIAYNWGAKNKQRFLETIKTFLKISVGVTLIGELVFLLGTKQIIQIYNVPDDIFNVAIPAFRILAIGFIFAGVSLTLSATFQAFGNGLYSLIVNLSRQIIFTLPFIILLRELIGINGIWISFTLAEIITMIIAIILYMNNLKKVLNTLN